jgi:intracellular sulfur oxidation DsrE/DsrF family protein
MTLAIRSCLLLLLMAAVSGLSLAQTPKGGAAAASGGGKAHHVAFQLSEGDDASWSALIVHVNNTMKALADEGGAEVAVVFWGPGIEMLKKSNAAYEERLKGLSDHGVKLLACRNAMKFHHLATEDLFGFSGQVDSGIAEIVKKQEAGWAYVH